MFAIGLTGMDLSASQRYFDIELINIVTTKNASGSRVKVKTKIPLVQCTSEHWRGVS